MRRYASILLVGTLLATGCMGPRPSAPGSARVVPPPRWLTDPGPARDPLPDWWRALNDPVLDDLVARAIVNNGDVLTAAARIQEADAQFRLARSAQRPSFDFSFLGVPRDRTYSTATGEGIIAAGYLAKLGLSYDPDLSGRLRNQTASARASLLGTTAAADAVRIATIAAVVQTYVGIRALDAECAIAQDTLATRRRQFALIQHQARVGAVVQVSVSEASAQLHSVEQTIVQLQLQRAQEEHALSLLLGDAPDAIPRGRPLLDLPILDTPATVPARLLRRRPDIYEAEQSVVAADRSLDSARAAFMPDLSLSATVSRLDANLLPNPLSLYDFMGSVLAPLYEGGRLRANADSAAAKRDEAAFAYRTAALSAFRDVEDALSGTRLLEAKERSSRAAMDDQAAALKAANRRFGQGYSSYVEVLDAERGLLSARLTAVETRGDRLTTMVKLYEAMGGGWVGPAGGGRHAGRRAAPAPERLAPSALGDRERQRTDHALSEVRPDATSAETVRANKAARSSRRSGGSMPASMHRPV